MLAADYLKTNGYIMINPINNQEILKSNNNIKIERRLPIIIEATDTLKAVFKRSDSNIKEIKLEDLQRYDWLLLSIPIPQNTTPWFPMQRIMYRVWPRSRMDRLPREAEILNYQPDDIRIIQKIKERKFQLRGRNTGPYGYSMFRIKGKIVRWCPIYWGG